MKKIQYKVKVKKDSNNKEYIVYKKKIVKEDFMGKPHEHELYNTILFDSFLRKEHSKVVEGKSWCYLDSLPEAVVVDNSKFLATVTVTI